jgi:hypothetical protein
MVLWISGELVAKYMASHYRRLKNLKWRKLHHFRFSVSLNPTSFFESSGGPV